MEAGVRRAARAGIATKCRMRNIEESCVIGCGIAQPFCLEWELSMVWREGTPPVFLRKSAQAIERKAVGAKFEFTGVSKECGRV